MFLFSWPEGSLLPKQVVTFMQKNSASCAQKNARYAVSLKTSFGA